MHSLSIIIVTYNSENEINNCLNSIKSSFPTGDYKIIIADNNSNDNTISILRSFDFTNIKIIINQQNLGFTKAVNQCLKFVTSKYILLLNPDTIIQDNLMLNLIKELEQDNSLGVIAPQLMYPDGSIQKSCRRFPRRRDIIYEFFGLNKIFKHSKEINYWKMGDFNHESSAFVDQPAGAALLFSSEIFQKIGYLDERFPMFFSDVDYCKRIINSKYKIQYDISASITHLGGVSVYNNRNKMIVSSHISFINYFLKYNKGILNLVFNLLIGGLLLLIIPFRILINILSPSLKYRKKQTL
jgi:GT2 family glycosyltransferase